MQGLIDHGLASQHHLKSNQARTLNKIYKLYFGLGQSLSLIHTPGVFDVSLAGIRLGHYLVQSQGSNATSRSFLDIGTGSGVHALLMRKLGSLDITATDISEQSIEQAKANEVMNFKKNRINFYVSDLFNSLPKRTFKTIIFNPPGWRAPSLSFIKQLNNINQAGHLPVRSMFYGDEVISRFLEDLPSYLDPMGTAIIGLNSLDRKSTRLNSSHWE